MLNRKLLEVLKYLTVAEKKRLRQFLISPYFNQGSQANDIIRLYDLIVRYDAQEDHPALSKAAVFALFFPGQQFLENVKSPLDALTSKLFKLLRSFLKHSESEQEDKELYEHLALARFYRRFAFEERFWQTMHLIRKIQQDSPLRDARYYFNQFRIEEEEQLFRGLYNSFEDDVNLNAVHNNLDLYYSILKLEYTCALVYQKRIAKVEEPIAPLLIDSVIELSAEGRPLNIPINHISRTFVTLLQRHENIEALESIDNMLDRYQAQIPLEKFKSFKAYIRFLWLEQYRKSGDDFLLRRIFDINRSHLQKGYFYIDGFIPVVPFRNLVIFALKLGEFDWAKKFLDDHPSERICSTRYPAEAHSLNLAELYFYLKKYEEARKTLVYRLFENPAISITVDLLLVKIYYETKDDLLDARMKALDQKIRRANISRDRKNRYYNFLKKLDKIIKYGWQPKNPKRTRLIEEIKTTPDIIAREWLLDKLGAG